MRQVLLLAANDLRLTLKDKPAFIWLLLMPVAMMWFLGGIGGGGLDTPRISLAVVNLDDGWLSDALIEELTDESVRLVPMTRPEWLESEDAPRALVIPSGFTDGVLAGTQQTLRLEKSASANESYSLGAQVHLTRVAVRSVARLIRMDTEALTDTAAAQAFHALGEEAMPVRLEVTTAGRGRPVPNGAAQSVPGTMTMTVLMMTLIYGAVFLTQEKRSGMLRRQCVLPIGRGRLFAGKLLGRFLIAGFQIVALVLAGRFLFGVSWGQSPLGLVLVLAGYALAVASLSTLLGAVLANAAQASSVGWILGMVMAAAGGCWWPAEVTPEWMRTASLIFPTAWAMNGFHALISFGHGLDAVIVPTIALIGFGALFSIAGVRWLRFDA